MDFDDIVWKYPRYKMESAKLIVGSKEPFDIKMSVINTLYLKRNFEDEYFPYFEISISVPYWVYNNVMLDPENVFMSIDFRYGMFDQDVDPTIPMTTEYKGKYKCIFEDVSPSSDGKWQLIREQEDGTINERYAGNDLMPLQMLLYNTQYYDNYDKVVEKILTSSTCIDALTYILTRGGISNVLISPPDNRKTYKEFKILPLPAAEGIYRICYEYQLYDEGAVIFFDLDRCYILSKKCKCDAWIPNEWKTTHLLSLQQYHNSSVVSGGHYKDSEEKCNIINIIPDSIMDGAGRDAGEKNFTLVNTATGEVNKVGSGKPSATYVYDKADDGSKIISAMSKETTKAFACRFKHCVLSALNPNKLFVVTIDDPKLKHLCGEYRIYKMLCEFYQEGNYWVPLVTAEFRSSK